MLDTSSAGPSAHAPRLVTQPNTGSSLTSSSKSGANVLSVREALVPQTLRASQSSLSLAGGVDFRWSGRDAQQISRSQILSSARGNGLPHLLIREARASGAASRAVASVTRILELAVANSRDLGGSVFCTEDNGLALEVTGDCPGREIDFVVPDDGSVRYFVARGPDRFRRAGVLVDDSAIISLARWLDDPRGRFPSRGVEVG